MDLSSPVFPRTRQDTSLFLSHLSAAPLVWASTGPLRLQRSPSAHPSPSSAPTAPSWLGSMVVPGGPAGPRSGNASRRPRDLLQAMAKLAGMWVYAGLKHLCKCVTGSGSWAAFLPSAFSLLISQRERYVIINLQASSKGPLGCLHPFAMAAHTQGSVHPESSSCTVPHPSYFHFSGSGDGSWLFITTYRSAARVSRRLLLCREVFMSTHD